MTIPVSVQEVFRRLDAQGLGGRGRSWSWCRAQHRREVCGGGGLRASAACGAWRVEDRKLQ